MEKLTPQNEHQEHMVQVLLAKMQGVQVEEYNDDNYFWHPSDSNCIFLNTEYRIAPKLTPLITREMLAMIAKNGNGRQWIKMAKCVFILINLVSIQEILAGLIPVVIIVTAF